MGGGSWNASVYSKSTTDSLSEHGTPFVYDKLTKAAGRAEVHPDLDPKLVAGDASPFAGKVMRESRDSDEHPESLPIAVIFDVTGSMGQIPVTIQAKLPKLYGLLLAKGYVEHPQILFGAVGDAYSDRVPLQIGQFESDNRADENLENLFLEGGGGGGNHESYELAAYFVARHTATDAWEKRGKKGYLFLIGDERTYSTIDPRQVADADRRRPGAAAHDGGGLRGAPGAVGRLLPLRRAGQLRGRPGRRDGGRDGGRARVARTSSARTRSASTTRTRSARSSR
jgi:hypothetical protein